jgi:DNA-binding MarR family transcriptional regulator
MMASAAERAVTIRAYRNGKLYRSLTRVLRVYNQRLVAQLHQRGFTDFSPAFPPLLSNLDLDGTRIGVLAARAGVSRQAAGQLLRQIEQRGYVQRDGASEDARATVISFTARGRKLIAAVFELVEEIEGDFASMLAQHDFEVVRGGLAQVANAIDPGGAFGSRDEPAGRLRKSAVTAVGEPSAPGNAIGNRRLPRKAP